MFSAIPRSSELKEKQKSAVQLAGNELPHQMDFVQDPSERDRTIRPQTIHTRIIRPNWPPEGQVRYSKKKFGELTAGGLSLG